jgi:hypothetical protein
LVRPSRWIIGLDVIRAILPVTFEGEKAIDLLFGNRRRRILGNRRGELVDAEAEQAGILLNVVVAGELPTRRGVAGEVAVGRIPIRVLASIALGLRAPSSRACEIFASLTSTPTVFAASRFCSAAPSSTSR